MQNQESEHGDKVDDSKMSNDFDAKNIPVVVRLDTSEKPVQAGPEDALVDSTRKRKAVHLTPQPVFVKINKK